MLFDSVLTAWRRVLGKSTIAQNSIRSISVHKIGFFCDLWSKGMEEENSGVFYSFYRFFDLLKTDQL